MLIFDIGSNKYEFVEACLERYRGCRVVAVDPISVKDFSLTKRQVTDRFLKQHESQIVHLCNVVSSTSGEKIPFYKNILEPGMSTASEAFLEGSRFALGNDNILEGYRQSAYLPSSGPEPHSGVLAYPDLPSFKEALLTGFPNMKAFLSSLRGVSNEMCMVETITLDELIAQHGVPDLIKIDVEGYESEVLRGLSRQVPKICFEWNEEMDSQLWESLEILKGLGYAHFGVSGYFVEGRNLENLSYDEGGDTYFLEPTSYCTYSDTVTALKPVVDAERRINWGMVWAK